ncbi:MULTISPECIES: EAL domain-containing protein [Rhizobium]|uniref:EAL domain-containing protein (Putative c-di-GMP-specific phosphodiesterase class I) n=1 Tax=Rhizobium paranaense TaxID=1650438 RepID=A0A7W9D1H0_9HYPH|nr:EAL domain-containing protein [Rhizobium paranaense]MBB5574188.1 EAL domain-containing protein (putative c-di-GMP-specific phosphodiesterase class I) [Rhizobium paranaense]
MSKAVSDRGLSFAAQKVSQIDVPDKVLYWECFARIVDARGVVHSASAFAPYLESSMASFDLDERMLDLILSHLARDPNLVLGCNISAANLAAPHHWKQICRQIDRHSELAPRLVLEITETYPLVAEGVGRLSTVRSLGCRVAIDNFGAGMATPARLLTVPADIIKIDASLVRNVRTSRKGQSSLHYLVGFASCVAPIIVAEGIETKEHLDAARDSGATHVQGFLFGKPASLSTQ